MGSAIKDDMKRIRAYGKTLGFLSSKLRPTTRASRLYCCEEVTMWVEHPWAQARLFFKGGRFWIIDVVDNERSLGATVSAACEELLRMSIELRAS